MAKKLPNTPRSRITSAIRRLWLYSRERAAALKRAKNCCESCGKLSITRKGGTVKLEVHHMDGIEWDKIIEYIQRHVLVDPSKLEVLCHECHMEEHHGEK